MNTYLNAQRDVQYAAPPLLAKWLESFKNSAARPRRQLQYRSGGRRS